MFSFPIFFLHLPLILFYYFIFPGTIVFLLFQAIFWDGLKKKLVSIPWKPTFSFRLKVIQTIRISVEHSSSGPLCQRPFFYTWANFYRIRLKWYRSKISKGSPAPDSRSFVHTARWLELFGCIQLDSIFPPELLFLGVFLFVSLSGPLILVGKSGWRGSCCRAARGTEGQPKSPLKIAAFYFRSLNIVAVWVVFSPPGLVLARAKTELTIFT